MITEVKLWGRTIGAVAMDADARHSAFEYASDFRASGIEVSPLMMPLGKGVFEFPNLPHATFHGLPGLLSDSLPDKFGNALIDVWLATQGRPAGSFSPLERLCYIGARGMGAIEFKPAIGPEPQKPRAIQIDALVHLASDILTQRGGVRASLDKQDRKDALNDILRVGTSAGGARAKAVIAWNPETNEIRSGQVEVDQGFESWLLKFDGVEENGDKELNDPLEYGVIEYAYHLMARAAGIRMSECRLLEENGRRHFMTRRFDRLPDGQKLHMQSLGALAHLDFNQAGAHSYEQALQTLRQLHLPMQDAEEQFRRMVFNLVARNQDDHVKNIAFLMNKEGQWSLSPAFDVTYNFNPSGSWTSMHQMTVNGKRDDFTLGDLEACAKSALLKRGRSKTILAEVQEAVSAWSGFASQAGVSQAWQRKIRRMHRLELPTS